MVAPASPSGPSLGALKIQLASAFCELASRVDARGREIMTRADLAYGLRLIVRCGREGVFHESLETSARVLGLSRKSVQRSREKLVGIGLLRDLGGKHGPGRTRRFAVRIAPELLTVYQARLEVDPRETGDTALSPDESPEGGAYRGHGETEQGTLEAITGDIGGPDRGQGSVPQTSEPMNLKEPAEQKANGVAIAAALAPVARGAARVGEMTEAELDARKLELARQKRDLLGQTRP